MTSSTRKSIMKAFWQLLDERPLNKITVKDIVEVCGINRNTFYYHFQDLPDLIEAITKEEADSVVLKHAKVHSFEECVGIAANFILRNRRVALHIYNSSTRDIFERYLMNTCDYIIRAYWQTAFAETKISGEDQELIISTYKCLLFGLFIDWLNDGLTDDILPKLTRMCELRRGVIETIFANAEMKNPNGDGP